MVAPTVFVNPEATLMVAAVSDLGVGVNSTPELVSESSTTPEEVLVSVPP